MKTTRSYFHCIALLGFLTSAFFTQIASADKLCVECVRIYSKAEYLGAETKYPRGLHNLKSPTAIASFTVNPPVSVLFYEGKGGTGRSWGPYKGLYKETSGTPGDPFSMGKAKISSLKVFGASSSRAAEMRTWRMRKGGVIYHGAGAAYADGDKSVSIRFPTIKTEADAWKKVMQLANENPSNPPVMWQLAPFSGSNQLVVHLKKFLSLPQVTKWHVAKYGKATAECWSYHIEDWGKTTKGKLHPDRLPLYYVADSEKPIIKSCQAGGYSTWSPGKPLIILPEGGNVILRPAKGKCGFRMASDALFGIDVDGKMKDAFTMKGTSCDISCYTVRGVCTISGGSRDLGYFPAGTGLHFYHRINGWGATAKTFYRASSRNLGTSRETFADAEVFSDRNKSLGFGGSVVERVARAHWILNLDDAAGSDDDDDDVPIEVFLKVRAGGLTVASVSSATSTPSSASKGQVKLFQLFGFKGRTKDYVVGQHDLVGDALPMGSFKVPRGLGVMFYEGRGLTGRSYGLFKGAFEGTRVDGSHGFMPRSIASIQVVDLTTKEGKKAEAEAKAKAKAEAEKKAAVAKAKAKAAKAAKQKKECKADVVFLMDNTGSMSPVIKAAQASAGKILTNISGGDPRFKGLDVKFGVATYWGDPKEHECESGGAVKLYQHWYYKNDGADRTFKPGTYNNITDTFYGYFGVSSYKVPSGLSLYMYSKTNGKGTQYGPFDGPLDIPCLANHKGDGCPHSHMPNDNVGSIKVVKTSSVPSKTKAGCKAYRGKACYWMENRSGNYCWVPPSKTPLWTRSFEGFARCQALDSCDGGGGLSGGGCYKWAECSDCKREPWSAPSRSLVSTPSTPSSAKSAGGVMLYSHPGYNSRTKKFASGPKDGREKQYGAGEYKTLGGLAPDKPGWFGVSSIKIPTSFTLEAWDGPNFTGKKYGPVKGPYSGENLPSNSSKFPNDKIASIKVTGGPKASGQAATTSGYQACARKAFKVEQPLTESRNVAANAMKRWKQCSTPGGCGGDLPEANFFALHQLATEGGLTDGKGSSDKGFATGYKVGWRDDAGRIVVWLGDAPSHDTTVDKAEVTAALLNKKIVVEAINMSKKSTGLDSVGPQGGLLPHYCSIKTCRFHPYYCKLFACETKGFCATQWRKDFDCGLLKKPAPLGQATKISQLTYGDVHHEISGGSAVVKTILQAAATGITNAGVGSAVSFNGGFLTQESQVYIGSMNPIDWSGDLQAWPLDPKTAAVDVGKGKNWSAAKQLDAGAAASRVMMSYRPTETTPKGKVKMHSGVPFAWNALNDTQRTDLRLNDTGGLDKKGEARLSFLHGKRDHEGKGHKFRVRGSRLGDIWRSRPVHVGAPGAPTANARQCGALRPFVHGKNKRQRAKECQLQHAFAKWHHSRTPVVYVGANDGALHGFDARSGKEVLAYFPAALYALTRTGSRKAGGGYHRLSSPDYIHKEYVDSPPAVFDAYMKTPGSTRSQWRTVLVGGLGGGGRGIYALDVTQPRSFNQANAKKVVMWEFTSEDDPHVGYTHSEVRVGRMNNGRYAVIFGNGPRDTGSGTAQLFVVYLDGPGVDGKWDEGRDYVRISTGRGSLDDPNALFTPTIVDVDGDGTVDRAYAGDAYGNMWAFDLAGKRKKWQAKALLLKGGGQSGRQPITAAPLVIKPNLRWMGRPRGESPGLMVLFGTGIFLHDRHKAITNTNAFYAIYDRGVTVNDVASQLVRQRLKEKTYKTKSGVSRKIRLMGRSNSVVYEGRDDATNPPKLGWYVKLPNAGERVVSRASVSWTAEGQAVIYFNSIVPDISICSSGGDGWEMAVSLYNGGNPRVGSYDINEDGVVDAEDAVVKDGNEVPAGRRVQGKGMPAGPVIFAGQRWTATTEVTDASKLQITKLSVIGDQPTGRLSYEQLFLRE